LGSPVSGGAADFAGFGPPTGAGTTGPFNGGRAVAEGVTGADGASGPGALPRVGGSDDNDFKVFPLLEALGTALGAGGAVTSVFWIR
jgi:hypothetical protein